MAPLARQVLGRTLVLPGQLFMLLPRTVLHLAAVPTELLHYPLHNSISRQLQECPARRPPVYRRPSTRSEIGQGRRIPVDEGVSMHT
jgi:hypothetical protein